MEVSLAHLDQFLTNYSIVYRNQDFVGGRLFPDFPVSKQNDRYPIFGFERFKAYNTERAPGSEANEMPGWRMSNDEYYCDGKAQKQLIPDELRAKWDFSTGPEVFTTETLADIIDKQREIQIYNLIMNSTTVPSTTLAGTGQWSDFQNSDPGGRHHRAALHHPAELHQGAQHPPGGLPGVAAAHPAPHHPGPFQEQRPAPRLSHGPAVGRLVQC